MTVSTSTNKVIHTADGIQTVFAYNYLILDEDHMKVYVDDALKTLTTDYTVSDVGNPSGGNVTFLVAPADQTQVTLLRSVPLTQLIDYQEYDPFPAETHERGLDLGTMADQQQQEELDRSLKAPIFDPVAVDYTLPAYDAGKALMWTESDPKGLTNSDDQVNGIVTAAQAAQAAAEAAQAAAEAAQTAAETAETNAQAWAEAAVGATPPGPTNASAKSWAQTAYGTLVDTVEYSAKHYQVLAAAWAEAAVGADPPGASSGSAKAWADTPEDTQVVAGKYSALHWAAKAEAAAASGLYRASEHVATAGQTAFTHPVSIENETISINGAILDSTDYSKSGTDLTLAVGADEGDIIRIATIGVIQTSDYVLRAGDTMTGDLTLPNAPTVDLHAATKLYADSTARNNLLINGDFRVWQRGVSFIATGYSADRWIIEGIGINAVQSPLEALPNGKQVTPMNFAVAAANIAFCYQRLEAYDSRRCIGQKVTASGWVKSGAGTAGLKAEIRYAASGFENFATTTVIETIDVYTTGNVPTDWTYFTVTFSVLPATIADGMQFMLYRPDTDANNTHLADVKLELGEIATPFKEISMAEEVARCQRFWHQHRMYSLGYAPVAGSWFTADYSYPAGMRASPTATSAGVVSSINSSAFSQAVRRPNGCTFYNVSSAIGQCSRTEDFNFDAEL